MAAEKKKLLTIAFAGHVKVPQRGGLQKGKQMISWSSIFVWK